LPLLPDAKAEIKSDMQAKKNQFLQMGAEHQPLFLQQVAWDLKKFPI
jgi:hypothetical protein